MANTILWSKLARSGDQNYCRASTKFTLLVLLGIKHFTNSQHKCWFFLIVANSLYHFMEPLVPYISDSSWLCPLALKPGWIPHCLHLLRLWALSVNSSPARDWSSSPSHAKWVLPLHHTGKLQHKVCYWLCGQWNLCWATTSYCLLARLANIIFDECLPLYRFYPEETIFWNIKYSCVNFFIFIGSKSFILKHQDN